MIRRAPVFRWMTPPAGTERTAVRVGELCQKATHWEFVYGADYLALGPLAWELDPTRIRTKQRSLYTVVGLVPHGVFCDVALSGWSLDALHKRRHELPGLVPGPGHEREPWGWWERLIYAPADGFGALFVGEPDSKPLLGTVLIEQLLKVTKATLMPGHLQTSSGAMGGERPKLTAYRNEGNAGDAPVILKFALPSERADSVVAEATALTLASESGLRVPAHRVDLINDVPALSIDRFDRGLGTKGPAYHCVSAATALDLMPGSDRDSPRRSYVLLRSKLKQAGDALELYRRIVLNAAVGNSDDHPWNTSLRQTGLGSWALSPLYDVMPFFAHRPPTVMSMALRRGGERAATQENLVAAGFEIAGLKPEAARAVVDEIFQHVRGHWRRAYNQHAGHLPTAAADNWASVFDPADQAS